MAVVKHSTTAAFGIEASPLQIGASTFVAESMTFSRVGNRVDIADDTGTVTGVAVVSAITEGSCNMTTIIHDCLRMCSVTQSPFYRAVNNQALQLPSVIICARAQ